MIEEEPKKRKTRKQEVIRGVMTWQILERVFNHYQEWHEVCLTTGNYDLQLLNGITINFHDILEGIESLPPRQKEALVLSCLYNYKEVEVARMMGFKRWSSQVGMYKRKALQTLCDTVLASNND